MQRRWMGSYRVSGEGTDRDHEILMTRQLTYIWLQRPASRAITATVLETRGMALETSHGVCNGCAASKTRLTMCQAQTAVGLESPCGQLDRKG